MTDTARRYVALHPGDPAPWFVQRTTSSPRFGFDLAAGRYVVLCFFGSAADPAAQAALGAIARSRAEFDDERACFFGITLDPADESSGRLRDTLPGIRFFCDFDASIARLYGAAPSDVRPGEKQVPLRRFWLVLDPGLRLMRAFAFAGAGGGHNAVLDYLRALPPPDLVQGFAVPPPVLFLPNVFEAEFCRDLIAAYEADGGTESGFMVEADGKTLMQLDPRQKRRRDFSLQDPQLVSGVQARIERRIAPELRKVHQFTPTRIERCIVSCYAAADGGHFSAHRDNRSKGTAHRQFAVSINLNDDFDGGGLGFPEYGGQTFKMPVGCAAVFSCSLLHRVTPVTRGRRYAFLPFLYDDAAARLRLGNNRFLGDDVPLYQDPVLEDAS